jgi:ubiquinone/menaquinone biosynthesis C-methylase UbiE
MEKTDYSKIAAYYDKGRSLSDKNIEMWLVLVSRYARLQDGTRVLDLGCGTGRFAIPMARYFRCKVTGADSSGEMLARSQEKDTERLVNWNTQDAQNLMYDDGVFDVVFVSHLLHHVDSPIAVLKECRRVLTNSGVIIVRYGSLEQIRQGVEYIFFPEALAMDELRVPTVAIVEKWLKDTGFKGIVTEEVRQQTYAAPRDHLESVKVKNISALSMISQVAFTRGVNRLEEYIKEHPHDPRLLFDHLTLTVGFVSG